MPPLEPNDTWSVDISEAAVAARNKDLVPSSLQIAINRCLEINIRGIFDYAKNTNESLESAITAVFQYIFNGSETAIEFQSNLKESAPILLKYFEDSEIHQHYLMNEIYSFICTTNSFIPLSSGILHAFYDYDLLEEDNIISWFEQHPSLNSDFKIQSESFVTWLTSD